MTYPQTPAGYPQGYPQTSQYAPQMPAPVQQHSAPPAGGDPFSDPSGGGLSPKMRELDGRTVIFRPHRVDEKSQYKEQSRPTVYTDILVVDGGPLAFGSNLDQGSPATHTVSTPALFRSAMVGNSTIVDALRGSVGTGIVVGVIQRGTLGNRPWMLVKTDQVADGAGRREAAKSVWFALLDGSFVPPQPVPLYAPAAGQAYGAPMAPGNYAPQPQYPQPAQTAPAAPGYPTPAQPAYAPQAPAQPAQSQGQPFAAAPDTGPPAGWDASVWQTLSTEQRRQILGAQPASPAPTQDQHPGY